MSFQSISDRLAILQESNAQLKDLIDRLANLKFRPGSVPLDNEDGNIITELTSEIQQTLREQDDDFGNLLEDVYDLPIDVGREFEEQKEDLDVTVKRAMKELKIYEKEYRRAYLSAKRNLEAAQKQERELLLHSYLEPRSDTSSPVPGQPRRKQQISELSKEEKEVNASSDVTLALRRTHDMMAAELSRSHFARETLEESSAALAQLSESYNTLDTLLSNSRNLLGTLLRSQKSDTWYLETAFYVLSATIAWLVFRRFFYGPMWWFLWFPVKMFIKGWTGVFTVMGVIGGSTAVSNVNSTAKSQAIIHSSATRGPRPTVSGARAPSVNVGGGGRGAPVRRSDTPPSSIPKSSDQGVSEQVGRIIDESQDEPVTEQSKDGTYDEETSQERVNEAENQPNPKKRMWEEPVEVQKEVQRKKDEL